MRYTILLLWEILCKNTCLKPPTEGDVRDCAVLRECGRLFHARAPATGNALSPKVRCWVGPTWTANPAVDRSPCQWGRSEGSK